MFTDFKRFSQGLFYGTEPVLKSPFSGGSLSSHSSGLEGVEAAGDIKKPAAGIEAGIWSSSIPSNGMKMRKHPALQFLEAWGRKAAPYLISGQKESLGEQGSHTENVKGIVLCDALTAGSPINSPAGRTVEKLFQGEKRAFKTSEIGIGGLVQ